MKHYGYQSNVFDLNHGWRFIEEDFSVLPSGREHNDVYNFSKAGEAKGPALTSFDDSEWDEVSLPHDWVTRHDFTPEGTLNHGYKKRGIGWYRNQFSLEEEDRTKQILLEFEGLSSEAYIYFNGQIVYRSFSGYQSFSVDVTDIANFGEIPNMLSVKINASAWEGWWYEGAGIYRPVWLIKKAPIHIAYQGQWIKPEKIQDGNWKVTVETEVENSFGKKQKGLLSIRLLDSSQELVASQSREIVVNGFSIETIKCEFMIENPELWSPESPILYQCRAQISTDEEDYLVTEFGFRTLRLDPDTGFWLNDVNRKLKGFCNHQDHAGVGVAVPYAVKEYRVKKLKEMGADAYRCAHNTDPEILEICDKLGMMVMEENRTFSTAEDNLLRLKQFVKNARNHPSVCMYSIFNEEPLQGASKGARMAARMQAIIKQMDETRPVLGAFNGGYMEEYGASGVLEAVGINYNQVMYDAFHEKHPQIPIVGSETASAFGVRGEYETDAEKHIFGSLDEEFAPWGDNARNTWKQVNERPFVAGNFVWTGFDYRGEPTPYDWPSVSTFFGVLDSCGFPKTTTYLYEKFYKKEAMIHIEPGWKRDVETGTPVVVKIITNCQEATIFLNGRKIGTEKAVLYDMIHMEIPYEPGELKAEGLIDGEVVCEHIVKTYGPAVKLFLESSKLELIEDGLDTVVVNVYAVDEEGTLVSDAEDMIHFHISGGGEIIGVGNGNPNSHEADLAEQRKLFHGCAQVIIKNCGKEDITLSADALNLEGAQVVIKTKCGMRLPQVNSVRHQQVNGWSLYYKLFDSMPEPNPVVEKSDMNSFEPVSFEGQPQSQLSGKYGKYALFRTILNCNFKDEESGLFFGNILGKAWVFLNGELLAYKENPKEAHLSVSLKKGMDHGVITVVVQNVDDDWQQAGILLPVFLQKTE